MIGNAHHYGVTVSDIDRSLEFYQDTLGLELESKRRIDRNTENGEKFSAFVGVEGAEVTIAFLDADDCKVELIEYHAPPGDDANKGVTNNDTGAAHFCFEVENIDRIYDELSSEVAFVHEPVTLESGNQVAYLYDPDGNTIEFADRSQITAE